MKTDTTYQIEIDKLQELIQTQDFEAAGQQVSTMLKHYNPLDYDLLLKRARMSQCQMKYGEAIIDSQLALNICPLQEEAYHALADFLITQDMDKEALYVLRVILNSDEDTDFIRQRTFERLQSDLTEKKTQPISKQAQKLNERILTTRRKMLWTPQLQPTPKQQKKQLDDERKKQAQEFKKEIAKEIGLGSSSIFCKHRDELKANYLATMKAGQVELSDEDEWDKAPAEVKKMKAPSALPELTLGQRKVMNERILGFQKSYIDETDPSGDGTSPDGKPSKKKKKNKKSTAVAERQIDFAKVATLPFFSDAALRNKGEAPFGEVYLMNINQIPNVDCKTCRLLFDYTKVCPHKPQLAEGEDPIEKFSEFQKRIEEQQSITHNPADIDERMKSVRELMKTFDHMSTNKETAYVVVQGQFSDVLILFLRQDLNRLMGTNSRRMCDTCSSLSQDKVVADSTEQLMIMEHALIILNRCLNHQINGIIQNTQHHNMILEISKQTAKFDFGVSHQIELCIQDEFRISIDEALKQQQLDQPIRFTTLSLLTQAFVNILLLSQTPRKIVKMIKKWRLIPKVIKVLLDVKGTIMDFQKADSNQKHNLAYFASFISHALRFFVICQSIDVTALAQPQEAGSLETCLASLAFVLRKYELMQKVFPLHSPLFDSLKSDDGARPLWLRHNEGSGCYLNAFHSMMREKKGIQDDEEEKEGEVDKSQLKCACCDKQQGEDDGAIDLKMCGQCQKVFYCSKECQKKNFKAHKRYCLTVSALRKEEQL